MASALRDSVRISLAKRVALSGSAIAWTVACLSAGLLTLVIAGVSLVDGLLVVVAVSIQGTAGAWWWRRLARTANVSIVELVGAGLGIGISASTLLAVLVRPVLGPWGWSVFPLLTVGVAVVWGVRRRPASSIAVPSTQVNLALAFAYAIGIAGIASFWRAHPVSWSEWWPYHADVVYHLGASGIVGRFGPNEQPFVFGEGPFRYHWLTNAWVGQLHLVTGVGTIEILSRLLYVVATIGVITMTWAIARRLIGPGWITNVTPLLFVTLPVAGLGVGWSTNILITAISPTHTLGMTVALTLVLCLIVYVSQGNRWLLPLIAMLSVATTVGRITHAAVLGVGIGFALLAYRWLGKKRWHRLVLAASILAIIFTATYVIADLGGSGSGALRTSPDYSAELGLIPWNGFAGPELAHLALLVAVSATWIGVIGLWPISGFRPVVLFGSGAGLVGLFGVTFIANNGSEESFLWSASMLLFVIGPVGAGLALQRAGWHPRNRGTPLWRSVRIGISIGFVVGIVGQIVVLSTPQWPAYGGTMRWMMPGLLIIAALVTALLLARERSSAMALFLAVTTVMGASGFVVATSARLLVNQEVVDESAPLAWTTEHIAAGNWLSEQIDDGSVIGTNRFCNTAVEPVDCPGAFPMVTALTGQRVLVEATGRGFSPADRDELGRIPTWAQERIDQQAAFAAAPSAESAQYLWNAGVRWFWIDKAVPYAGSWGPFAEVVYQNDVATILRLVPPSSWD